jgi:hypothetical protein
MAKKEKSEQAYELTSMADLKPAPYNDIIRKIEKTAAAGLGKSIDTFGDISGITWNRRTGWLVAGHKRVAQLRKRGAELVAFDDGRVEIRHGDNVFPVRVVDWEEGFEKGANVEANNRRIAGDFTAELAGVLGDVERSMSELQFEELRFDDLKRDVTKASNSLSNKMENIDGFKAEYHVMVTVPNEVEQAKLLERMESEGYKVRALMS